MKERIYRYLETGSGEATSEEIAGAVLKLRGAVGQVADRVVEAAVEDDRRFVRGPQGVWRLRNVVGTPLREATFVTMGARVTGPQQGAVQVLSRIAGRRFGMAGDPLWFPEARVTGSSDGGSEALAQFGAFAEGAIPAAFRLPRLRRLVDRSARALLGRPLLGDGICLYRLGRRVFPDRTLPSLDVLAEAAGLSYLTERRPEEEAGLQAELLLFLLERYEVQGITTVEAVASDLYPEAPPVPFEAFAFDEAFLAELPRLPGVYVMRDREGGVIYVGKSISLRERVRSYFARRPERSEKTRGILERIWSMEVETVGSELEALLLEGWLIRRCRPEFNTQVAVHPEDAAPFPAGRFVLPLPSSEPACMELFCVREGLPVQRVRASRDLSDWEAVAGTLRALFFAGAEPESPLSEEDAADLEILRRWVARNRASVQCVDMEGLGDAEEALRVVGEYVRNDVFEGWEKVWRV